MPSLPVFHITALLFATAFIIPLAAADPAIPAWATAVEKDAAGAWAKLAVGGQVQVMRWVPAGSFQRKGRTVTISQAFWLADSEVTQAQWKAVMEINPSSFTGNPARPVEQVSWTDCQEFLLRINGQVRGLQACLPSEAQWEYACRAGSTGDYAGEVDALAWYDANSAEQTHPVKAKAANPWGLFDMHGNVWEWCNDWSGEYPVDAAADPLGAASGTERVLRGGAWNGIAGNCRSAVRGNRPPDYRSQGIGLRFAAAGR